MKSVNEILNSIFAPSTDPTARGGNSVSSKDSSNQGSFGDILGKLASQTPDNGAGSQQAPTNSSAVPASVGTQSSGTFQSVLSVSEVDIKVTETGVSTGMDQKQLQKLEQGVEALAAGLSELLSLASNLQSMNPQQAQNFLVSASGGAISPGDAQKFVQLIQSLSQGKDASQNPLLMSSGDQKNLLAQMFQQMVQNAQMNLVPNSGNSGAVSPVGVAGSSNSPTGPAFVASGFSLQINFSETRISETQSSGLSASSLTMDLQSFQLKMASIQGAVSSSAPMTDEQLQAAVQNMGMKIQTMIPPSSALAQSSPDLVQNFKNLVQALSQSGAGQVVLNTFLGSNKNDAFSQQALAQPPSLDNLFKTLTATAEIPAVVPADSITLGGENPLGGDRSSKAVLGSSGPRMSALEPNQETAQGFVPPVPENQNSTAAVLLNPNVSNSLNFDQGTKDQATPAPALAFLSAPQIDHLNHLVDQMNLFAAQAPALSPTQVQNQGVLNNFRTVNPLSVPSVELNAAPPLVVPPATWNPQTAGLNLLAQEPVLPTANPALNIPLAQGGFLAPQVASNPTSAFLPSGNPVPVLVSQFSTETAIPTPEVNPNQAGPVVQTTPAFAPSTVSEIARAAFTVETFRLSEQAQTTAPAPVPQPVATGQNLSTTAMTGVAAQGSFAALSNNGPNPTFQNLPTGLPVGSDVRTITPEAVTPVLSADSSASNLSILGDWISQKTNNPQALLESLAGAIGQGLASNGIVGLEDGDSKPEPKMDPAQILNQVTDQIAAHGSLGKEVSQLSFQLEPANLGRVSVQIGLVDQAISARIVVTHPDVREVLQQHLVDLKTALSNSGLQIGQMEVHVQGGGAGLLGQYYQYQRDGFGNNLSNSLSFSPEEESKTLGNSGVLGTSSASRSLVDVLA